jgi:toxin CcdB
MAQFDAYPNPGRDRDRIPYLLDVQVDLLADLATRLVVPLAMLEPGERPYLAILHPRLHIGDRELVMLATEMAHVPARLLQEPVANLRSHSPDILRAIDALFAGV